jgi:hypothetical protein
MKYSLSTILLLLTFSGCRDLMQIPDAGRKIVVSGFITNDSLLSVRIGTSSYILNFDDGSMERQMDLKGANVRIFQNEVYADSLYHVLTYGGFYDTYDWDHVFIRGNYRSKKIFVKEGNEYAIIVNSPGYPEATAHFTVPKVVGIESVDTTHVIMPPGEYLYLNTGIACKIRFSDPPDIKNYYILTVNKVPTANPFNNNIEINSKDPVIEEMLHSRAIEGVAFSDKVINGQTYTLSIIIRDESIAHVQTAQDHEGKILLYFRLYSIPEEYFIYIRTLNQYEKNLGNPLADPVMMFSNVTGGFGMFAGAAVSSVSINYPDI